MVAKNCGKFKINKGKKRGKAKIKATKQTRKESITIEDDAAEGGEQSLILTPLPYHLLP